MSTLREAAQQALAALDAGISIREESVLHDRLRAALAQQEQEQEQEQRGMTLRDYFAAKAIAGLMVRNWSHHTGTDEELIAIWARSAYGVADAMLAERSKT